MRIGYCVEGSTDQALLVGLRNRLCPTAELIEGRSRGAGFRRREIPKACYELHHKGADVIILLRDANDEFWRDVAKADRQACPSGFQHMTIVGICDRNVECWLVAHADYAAQRTSIRASDLRVKDPKPCFTVGFGITALNRKEDDIVQFVFNAPLKQWLSNDSFAAFYEELRLQSKRLGCNLENLREN